MEVLQVKEYHRKIAMPKQLLAIENWKEQENGYGYPTSSMYFFMLMDTAGYPTEKRKSGYIAFEGNRAVFGMSEEKAISRFNKGKKEACDDKKIKA